MNIPAANIKRGRRKAPKRSPDKNDLSGLFVLLLVDRTKILESYFFKES